MASKTPAGEGDGIHPVSGHRLSPNHNFEKLWTLGAAADAIEKLKIEVPGLVYVSYDASKPTSVRFSGDSSEILAHVEVAGDGNPDSVHVRAKGFMSGHLLTEISLHRAATVRALACAGSATTVVEDGVLANDPQHSLALDAAGSGDVFVGSSATMQTHSVVIRRSGSGDVQIVVPAIHCKAEAHVHIKGSGDVNVFAGDLHTQSARFEVHGSGDVNVNVSNMLAVGDKLLTMIGGSGNVSAVSRSLDASAIAASIAGAGSSTVIAWDKLAASTIQTDIAGSGNAVVACAGVGTTSLQTVNIAGSGNVDVADVLADSSKVNIAGSGNVAVRVGAEAHESLFGSGDVEYVGGQPRELHTAGLRAPYNGAHRRHAARPLAAFLGQEQRFPTPVPAREAAFSQIRADQVSMGGDAVKSALGSLFRAFRS